MRGGTKTRSSRKGWWLLGLYAIALLAHHLVGAAAPAPPTEAIRILGSGDGPVAWCLREGPARDQLLEQALEEVASVGRRRVVDIDLRALARAVEVPSPSGLAEACLDSLTRRSLVPTQVDWLVVGDATETALELLQEVESQGVPSRSMVLWRATGVVEFDLLGTHELNHLLYSIVALGTRFVHEAIPHFGLFGPEPVWPRVRQASDRRPVRARLRAFGGAVWIVDEAGSPTAVASREHARLMPQSEFTWLRPDARPSIVHWLDRVEGGQAITRSEADGERVRAAAAELGRHEWVRARGDTLRLLIFLLVLGTFITEDLTSIAAGLLIADGRLSWEQGLAAVFCGIYFGDQSLYLLGRVARRNVVHRRPWKWFLRASDLDRAARWFEQRGLVAILLTRFIPGTRLPTYVAAGVVRAGYWRFAAYFFVAVALWTPLLVGFSARVGSEALVRLNEFRTGSVLVFVGLAVSMLVSIRLLVPLCSSRGRRQLWAQWQRLRHWEFWPAWLVYLPVAGRILGMARRYGGLRTVTAVNPGMPAGGLIGESKADILEALSGGTDCVPAFARIPAGSAQEQRAVVESFLERPEIGLPVVIKPDRGERGQGVVVVHRRDELDEILTGSQMDWIVQEFVPGLEFGVFYVRRPEEPKGHIISINRKERLRVRGDGVHDLEHLIVHDARAGILAEMHLRANASRLGEIPARGEEVEIVEVGAHARGTVFRDARDLRTEALEDAVERLSRRFDGFFFGRYDLRVSSEQSLRAGEGLKVLELNGLTSESAHIYDPAFSLSEARRTLVDQWEMAFEIGLANIRRGHRPATWRELFALWQQHRHQSEQRLPMP